MATTLNIKVDEDDTTNLVCPFGGQLIHNIMWIRYNEGITTPLSTSTRVLNTTSSNLVISPTRWYDSGVYECYAESNIGNWTYKFGLSVNTSRYFCLYLISNNHSKRLIDFLKIRNI